MNIVDLIICVLALLAALRGWQRGLLGQAFELGGGFLGLIAGIALGPRIASLFTQRAGVTGLLVSIAVVFVALTIGQTVGYVIGHRFGMAARRARLGTVDSGLGSAFSIGVTLVSFWLVGSLLVAGPSQELAQALRRSAILDTLNDTATPPNLLAYLRQYLNTSGFPQVFVGLPPEIGPPVDLPSGPEARRAVQAALDSTVRIVAPACGGTQLGSGWIVAANVVVTNAHVVAGGDSVTVQEQSGADHGGSTVVLFDKNTDIALIRTAAQLDGPVLDLSTERLDRGAPGATLGYPGSANGQLRPHPAAVQNRYEAVGYDIYGRTRVTREVYELRAPVRQGDSGGPFVQPDGDVVGVVFAASTTDSDTGYALTGAEIEDEVRQGINSTEAVGTGRCTR